MASQRRAWSRIWRSAASGTFTGAARRPAPCLRPQINSAFTPSIRFQSQWPGGRRPRIQYQRFGNEGPRPGNRLHLLQRYRGVVGIVVIGGVIFYVYNLETVPISGRRRFNWISQEQEEKLAAGEYEQQLRELKGRLLPQGHPYVQLCARVVNRLVQANGLGDQKWTLHVVQDDSQTNAFVMPGGQIFVFTGIIPVAKTEDGLAAILGHEISHKLAGHVGEKISGQVWLVAFVILAAVLGDFSLGSSKFIYDLAFTLRNSRTMENEADHLGLLMSARACYDPKAAISFWTRMLEVEKRQGGSVPALMSTHPASADRVKYLQQWIPEAELEAEKGDCSVTSRFLGDFKDTMSASWSQARESARRNGPVFPGPRSSSDDDDDWF